MVYKKEFLILAIIFIIIAAILYLAPIPQPPYLAIAVLAIGIGFLILWAILTAIKETRST